MSQTKRNKVNIPPLVNFVIKPATQQITTINENEASVPKKKRKVLSHNAREVVVHLLQTCEFEKSKDGISKPLTDIIGRTAILTGVSEETITIIISNNWKPKPAEEVKKPDPKKKPTSTTANDKVVLDDREIMRIKNLIRDYHIENVKAPSMKELLQWISEQIPGIDNNESLLQRVLHHIGYRKKKLQSKRTLFIEDPVIVASRDEYLKKMFSLRKENRTNVFYVYECVINRFHTFYKSWIQKYGNNEALHDKHTFTLICAASSNGFLKKATLLRKTIIEENSSGQITPALFEKWLKDTLIPNLPKNSIIVMENAPHHCASDIKVLSYYASKQEMVDFLETLKIKCSKTMRRGDLYKMVQDNTQKGNHFIVEDLLRKHGHESIYLPSYMIDLSPSQLAMDQLQEELYNVNDFGAPTLKAINKVMEQLMASLNVDDWRSFAEKVVSSENEYWRKDGDFEEVYDKIIKDLREKKQSDTEESSDESDIEEDS